MKIPTIITGKDGPANNRQLKVISLIVLAVALIGAASWLVYLKTNQEDKATFPPGYTKREQAYDFVSLWGSYNGASFGQRDQDLKAQMTPGYYQETFGGDLAVQKQRQIAESGVDYVTLPVDTLNEIELANETGDSFDATVYAEETLTTDHDEKYFDQIVYNLSFVKQDNRFLLNHISAERSSEQPPHTE